MYKLNEYKKLSNRFRELIEKTRFKLNPEIKNLLFLASTKDDELCLFEIVKLFNQRTNINFIFGITEQPKYAEIDEANILQEDFTTFIQKTREKMAQLEREDFSIVLIEGSSFSPYEKLRKLLEKIKTSLIIIPYPFLNFTKENENIDEMIEQLIELIVVNRNIPLLLLQSCQYSLDFSSIDLILRGVSIRRDILGWILTLISEKSEINTFKTGKIDQKDYKRLLNVLEALNLKLLEEKSNVHFNNQPDDLNLDNYCELMPDGGKLVIFQDINNAEDAKYIYETLCVHSNSTLILPPD